MTDDDDDDYIILMLMTDDICIQQPVVSYVVNYSTNGVVFFHYFRLAAHYSPEVRPNISNTL